MPLLIENPRFMPGSISGAGMEHTPAGRLVDIRYAINLDYIDGCLIEHPEPGLPAYALALAGDVNDGSGDRARCLLLFPPEKAASLIDRLVSLASMVSPEFRRGLVERISRLVPADIAAPEEDEDEDEGRQAA